MIVFLNPTLAAAFAAIAVPIMIHIAHRRKIKQTSWGAMKFLQELLHKRRQRIWIDQWLLLIVRILLICALVITLMRPVIRKHDEFLHTKTERTGKAASVILFDDSASTSVGRTQQRIDDMKELAKAYLKTLKDGDEISFIKMSEINMPAAEPLFDRTAVENIIMKTSSKNIASDIPALIEHGIQQFVRHINTSQEIVLIHDNFNQGWRKDEDTLWTNILDNITPSDNEAVSRKLIILAPEMKEQVRDIAVESICLDRSIVSINTPTTIFVTIKASGNVMLNETKLKLIINENKTAEQSIKPGLQGMQTFSFVQTFDSAGIHTVRAVIEGSRDDFPKNDQRDFAFHVLDKITVLLIEADSDKLIHENLGLVHLSLDPTGDKRGFFRCERISASELSYIKLDSYHVVILGDVLALDQSSITAIERYLASGGTLFVLPGPKSDMDHINRFWARYGDGFLPAPFMELKVPEKPISLLDTVTNHPALLAFTGYVKEALKECLVYQFFTLHTEHVNMNELQILLRLSTGDPLLLERKRGFGRVMMLTTGTHPQWSQIAAEPFFVPLMRGIVEYLASIANIELNIDTGDRLLHISTSETIRAFNPDKTTLEMTRTQHEGRSAFVSKQILHTGIYTIEDHGKIYKYAVNLPASEFIFDIKTKQEIEETLSRAKPIFISDAEMAILESHRDDECWRFMLAITIALLFFETLITRLQAGTKAGD